MTSPRLSLNQKTTEYLTVAEAVDVCISNGVQWIGLWREQVAATGLEKSRRIIEDAGLSVSSLCRGGFFPADTLKGFEQAIDENKRVVDEAVALGTDVVVLVCGGIAGGSLERSREQVIEGIGLVAPYAGERGVKLAIEPMHPMYGADRSVVVTLRQALDIAERYPAEQVGVAIDTFHLWWDPEVWGQIARASGRILSYQVCDWLDPLPGILMGRGMMGDGVIDFSRFTVAVSEAGYDGPIEVEIFNHEIWNTPAPVVVATMIDRFEDLVVGR